MRVVTLIIDDDPMICFIHKKLVKKYNLGGEVLTFSNGREALNYLLSFYHLEYNFLIMLDINMPVMNGWEFLQEIESQLTGRNLHVTILSSSIQLSDRIKAKAFNYVVDFLEKPVKPENIEKIMNAFVTG